MKQALLSICICLGIWTVPLSSETLDLQSDYVYLMNVDDTSIVYDKNGEDTMYPASLTKVMTLLVALEHIVNIDEQILITSDMLSGLKEANASVAGFIAGEQVSMKDLLYGVMLASGADACRAISITLAGSEEDFVVWMNEKAKELALENTHFTNTTGLHDEDHYSTAKDLAIITREALKNSEFYEIFTAFSYTTMPTQAHRDGIKLNSTLRMMEKDEGLTMSPLAGGKTGYTNDAKYCLVSYFETGGTSYILVSAHADEKNYHIKDAHSIFQYIDDRFVYKKIKDTNSFVTTLAIKNSWTRTIDVTINEDIYALLDKNVNADDIKVTFEGSETYFAPMSKDVKLGDIVISYVDDEVKRIPYVLSEDILDSKVVAIFDYLMDNIAILLIMLTTVCFAFLIYVKRKKVEALNNTK